MSSFLVVAALIAAGGTGRFLWNYQARLDHDTAAPDAAVAAADVSAQEPPAPAGGAPTQVTEILPTTPPPAPTRRANKPVRGDIQIVGRNGTTSSVAPPTREDLAAGGAADRVPPPSNPAPGARIYKPDDPNPRQPSTPPAHRYGPLSWE